jgi:sigma-B regulation protein RsbU (phosphoserine phosphatase)
MSTGDVYERLTDKSGKSLDEQLALLAEITQSFATSLDISETLQNAIEKFMQYLDAEAASIFLLEEEPNELVCRSCVGPVDIVGLRLPAGAGIVGKTVTTCSSQMVRNADEDPDFASIVDRDTGFKTRSILCAPLMVGSACIGALELINKRSSDGLFDVRDRDFLVALAAAASLAIHNAHMADSLVEQERLQRELELARRIQESLLPLETAEDFPVQGINVPALEVSGDFYDYFQRDDGLIYFNLADVAGKGMNAALLMAKVSSLLHHLAKFHSDAGELLSYVNKEICDSNMQGMFVTIVSGFLDPRTGVIRLANAGHQPPLLQKQRNEFVEFEAEAPPLGVLPGTEFPVTEINLNDGCLYLFTDGVTESRRPDGRVLGVDGLIDLIKKHSGKTPCVRVEGIINDLFTPGPSLHDDITMMVIQCAPR